MVVVFFFFTTTTILLSSSVIARGWKNSGAGGDGTTNAKILGKFVENVWGTVVSGVLQAIKTPFLTRLPFL